MKNALVAGIVSALIWSLLQFSLSEIFYQLSRSSYDWGLPSEAENFLIQASDIAAFPAGWIYEEEEKRLLPLRLGEMGTEDQWSQEVRERARDLRSQWRESPPEERSEVLSQAYDFIYTHTSDPIVPVTREYLIYIGVCLAWGTLIGILVFLFILLELKSQQNGQDS